MKWKFKLLSVCMAGAMLGSLSTGVFADTPVRPKAIKFTNVSGTKTISAGDEFTIEWEIQPPDADTSTDVTFSSSYPNVADVDDDGNVYAYEAGETTITARTANGITRKITVRVPGRVTSSQAKDTANDTGERDKDISRSSSSSATAASSAATSSSKTSTKSSAASAAESGKPIIKLTEKLDRETLMESVKKGGTAKLSNYLSVSSDSLKAAAGVGCTSIRFDTKADNTTIGRLTINPANVKDLEGDLKLGVYCNTSNTARVDKLFANFYKNDLRVVRCDQTYYLMTVRIAVRAGDLPIKNLHFYGYDPNENQYFDLTVDNVKKDKSGYLHFNTTMGGYIIISDGELVRK